MRNVVVGAVLLSACARSAPAPARRPATPRAPAAHAAGTTTVYLVPPTEPLVDATFDRDVFGPHQGPRGVLASPAVHRAATFVLEHLQADAAASRARSRLAPWW